MLVIRIVYGIVSVGVLLFLLMLRSRIAAANDETIVRVPPPTNFLGMPTTTQTEDEDMMIVDYDNRQVSEMLKQRVMQTMVTLWLHLKMGMVIPLAMQAVAGTIRLPSTPLVQAHWLGVDLPRPFPQSKWYAIYHYMTRCRWLSLLMYTSSCDWSLLYRF